MAESLASPMDIPTICFGFTLGFIVLTGAKIGKQSISIWKRTGSIWNMYLFLVWAEFIVNFVWAVISWLFLRGDIKGSFAFYFTIATLWTLQTQCLLQIIANRVALVMTNKRHSKMLKLGLLIAVGLINVSVYCVWIPARMEVSPTWVFVNEIWDRIEKVIYLLMDLALNAYFLWLVRSRLISRGLTKYAPLFKFNVGMVVISISMDALIIGMMSLPDGFVYTQFHSLAYIVKLKIELSMADLISKVVRKQDRTDKPYSSSDGYPSNKAGTELTSTKKGTLTGTQTGRHSHVHDGTIFQYSAQAKGANDGPWSPTSAKAKGADEDAVSDSSSDSGINFRVDGPQSGIVKTVAVETTVVSDWSEEHERREAASRERSRAERGSTSSSTAQLNEYIQQAPRDRV